MIKRCFAALLLAMMLVLVLMPIALADAAVEPPNTHPAPVYTSASFEEDNWRELYKYPFGVEILFDAREIVMWTWPGSGVVEGIVNYQSLNAIAFEAGACNCPQLH